MINFNFREKQCFGFLQFEEDSSVDKAIEVMNDNVIDGTQINGEFPWALYGHAIDPIYSGEVSGDNGGS